MAEIPESLLRRSAEAKAKALGVPVEQVLAEMKGETPAAPPPPSQQSPPQSPPPEVAPSSEQPAPPPEQPEAEPPEPIAAGPAQPVAAEPAEPVAAEPAEPVAAEPAEPVVAEPAEPVAAEPAEPVVAEPPEPAAAEASEPETTETPEPDSAPAEPAQPEAGGTEASGDENAPEPGAPGDAGTPEPPVVAPATDAPAPAPEADRVEAAPAAVAVEDRTGEAQPDETTPDGNGQVGNGARVAASVSPRPLAPPSNIPEGVRTQRLLTVVKARAIQNVRAEPSDKVNTWPHLMIAEFTALLAMTALLLIMSVVLQAPLLEPANFNATPNPSKAPWYFLGLQELLSYFDPQIAGVTVPTIIGLVGFMMIPYLDKNPSTKPSDRKYAIMLFTIFLTGSATLTMLGVLFRGQGFNFAYPWRDGVFFDDLKDWVHFE